MSAFVPGAPGAAWPPLPVDEWADTRDTLQLWAQIVGKVRMSHTPLVNHWWNVPFYVTASGLTTSLMWDRRSGGLQMDFDFMDHLLVIRTSGGAKRTLTLEPRSVASFWAEFSAKLAELGIEPDLWTMPVEIPGAVPFDRDEVHSAYDRAYVERFFRSLVSISEVLLVFRAHFVGKASPVHLFWGALDLAVTRFSGRPAPPHGGGAPHCGPHVMLEAYSHEVSSAGYWPGGGKEGAFYSYAYPEPPGYREAPVSPAGAYYDPEMGEFLLPYEVVRAAPSPGALLMEFLQSTYEAAANTGDWDRKALERQWPSWAPDGFAHPGAWPGHPNR